MLAPEGPVYQAGTLSGNPIAMTAGLATLSILSEEGLYERLNAKAATFIAELQGILRHKGVVINSVGNMFTPYFTEQSPRNFQDVNKSDLAAFAQFWRHMFANGIYLSPSQFESNFISIAHTDTHLGQVLNVANRF